MPRVVVYRKPPHGDGINLDDLRSLVGLTVPEAVAKMHALGYKGDCRVDPPTVRIDRCAEGRVCSAEWRVPDVCILTVNNKPAISAPP